MDVVREDKAGQPKSKKGPFRKGDSPSSSPYLYIWVLRDDHIRTSEQRKRATATGIWQDCNNF